MGVIPRVVPFFFSSGGADGSGVAGSSDWSVCSGCLMLSCSFASAMVRDLCDRSLELGCV